VAPNNAREANAIGRAPKRSTAAPASGLATITATACTASVPIRDAKLQPNARDISGASMPIE
jgi:hypothetical protein